MEYLKVFKTLRQFKVRYLICGGLAVNIYGIPRMTADIDILLDFDEENINNFESAVKQMMYQQSIPVSLKSFISPLERKKAIEEKNLIAYSYFNAASGGMTLDVLLDTPFEFNDLWEKRTMKHLRDTEIYLIDIEDLIAMKKYSNRIQDQNDILLLSKLVK
ncbi:MAG: hypothetical protein K0S12_1464 [Bacteroidetes bacterium]|jgi:hypothetical protein|nr:hypothetical protein [Bacteroidota bacterium]